MILITEDRNSVFLEFFYDVWRCWARVGIRNDLKWWV